MSPTATFAGQVGITAAGTVPESVPEQTEPVLAAVRALLHSQNAGPGNLTSPTTYVVGGALAVFNAVRDQVYDAWFPGGDDPPKTLLLVAGLAAPPLRVEIQGSLTCP